MHSVSCNIVVLSFAIHTVYKCIIESGHLDPSHLASKFQLAPKSFSRHLEMLNPGGLDLNPGG